MVTVGFSLFMVGRCKKFNNNHIEVAQHWENHFRWALNRFNSIYKDEIECCTPHVARHTFCSNMASLGMYPKTLQTIMGHSSVGVTMDVYTHVEARDVQKDFRELMKNKQYSVYPLDGEPDIVVFSDDEEFQAKLQQKWPAKAEKVYQCYRTLNINFCKSTDKVLGHLRDEKDIPVLSDAIYNKVDIILTGDKDFLEANLTNPLVFSPSMLYEYFNKD